MYLLKYLIVIMSISSCLTLKTKLKQEQSILVSFLGINLLTYVLGLLDLLQFSIIIIYIISVISFIYVIVLLFKDKTKINRIFTLSTVMYIVILIIMYFATRNMFFTIFDEYMFWGTNLKGMVQCDILWANKSFDGIHLTYPPFSAVNEYIFCKFNGEFKEGCAFFGNITFLFTMILYVFKDEKWNVKSILKEIYTYLLLYCIIILLQFKLSTLLIDLLLGIIFFVSFYVAYTKKDTLDYFILTLFLIALTMIKVTGILLVFVVLFYLIIDDVIENKKVKLVKRIKPSLVILFTILIMFCSWQLYCSFNNTVTDDRHDKHSTESIDLYEFLNAVFLNKDKCSEKNYKIAKDFYNYLLFNPISKIPYISSIILIIILNCAFLMIYLKRKNKRIISLVIALNLGFIGYALSILFTFMFVFVEFQGESLMGIERYINTYLIVYILLILFILNEKFDKYKLSINVLTLILLISMIFKDFYVTFYILHIDDIPNTVYSDAECLNELVEDDKKVFIVLQDSSDWGRKFVQLRYLISPIKTNLLYEWNITTEEPEVYYQTRISEKDLENILINENYDYIYFSKIDDEFKEEYAQLFSNSDFDIEPRSLYKINEINNELYFTLEK